MRRETLPRVALVLGNPRRARRRAKRETIPRLVDIQTVTIDEIVSMLLRQPFAQYGGRLSAVACAGDDQRAVDGNAPFVLSARKRLHDEDFIGFPHRIGKRYGIFDALAANEDNDVVAHAPLIVEHIAAQTRIGREHGFEHSANCAARGFTWRS